MGKCQGCKYEHYLWIPQECFNCKYEAHKDFIEEVTGVKKGE